MDRQFTWRRPAKHVDAPGRRTPDVVALITTASAAGAEYVGGAQASWWVPHNGHDGPYEVRYYKGIRMTVRWRRHDGWVWTVVGPRGRRGRWAIDRMQARADAERTANNIVAMAVAEEQEWARRAGPVDDEAAGYDDGEEEL